MTPPFTKKNLFFESLSPLYSSGEISAVWRWVSDVDEAELQVIIHRLQRKEPLQYILGYTWFYNRKLIVSDATLIPRPETEELCDMILHSLSGNTPIKALDVGTGSGCIPVTLATEQKNITFDAVDISKGAIKIAVENAEIHGVKDKINCIEMNFLDTFPIDRDYQLIVSNPPYIKADESHDLEENVIRWEPHSALFPDGNDPLIFYKRLFTFFSSLKNTCEMWLEINPLLSAETLEIYSGKYDCELLTDLSGSTRFLRIKKEGQ